MKLPSLKSREHFEEFRSYRPFRFSGKYILILSLKKNIEKPRVGIRISRKIGNAVRRNRIRRIIRETLRQNIDHLAKNRHYLIIPFANTRNLSNRALSKAIRKDLANGLKLNL